jgi:hypothetical protein
VNYIYPDVVRTNLNEKESRVFLPKDQFAPVEHLAKGMLILIDEIKMDDTNGNQWNRVGHRGKLWRDHRKLLLKKSAQAL